jgi:hypothetical protein
MKPMQKMIVTSATYRQSSRMRQELASRDPQNKLLARQSSIRLPAELIRDSALAVSGLLDPRVGGKSVEPYLPASLVSLTFGSGSWVNWTESQGQDRYRRGVYIHRQRTLLYPLLANFDAPNPTVTACKREISNTPLQALNLLNDPVFLEMARGLANRVLSEVTGSFADRLRHSYVLALGRPPSVTEQGRMLTYYQEQSRILEQEAESVRALFPYESQNFDRKEGAAWVLLSRVILNLDEFLTRE